MLVKKSVENGDFAGCDVNDKCFVDVLQFADNTLLVGDGSWNHLWAIKVVLRAFELVSGLDINFNKNKLIGVNIISHFLDIATNFLACRLESKEFNFLGIKVGINPRRADAWRPLVESVRKRLNTWKSRFNFGGRMTLLKSVLGSLPIFTLSICKAPKKVICEINKIQSNFLWGGVKDKRSIHWVC
ncbi:uncharacterized protein LOC131614936 [Vicia villosa]|uniref:uncharacterized protein LOC131614936 n=1 Tax=Vicia villosa TaxID=3911 RepID=UPI00273BD26F|nr:uncharacterized protein LOC131614936 [Vicia villosa]